MSKEKGDGEAEPTKRMSTDEMRGWTYDSLVDGNRRRLRVDPEDVFALFAGIVALAFAIAMIAGWVPINAYTVAIVGFSGAGLATARVIKARKPSTSRRSQSKRKSN